MPKLPILKIKKRDGRVEAFNQDKIIRAIEWAGRDTGEYEPSVAIKIAEKVMEKLGQKYSQDDIPTVEEVQDIVEPSIAEAGFFATAKHYILYRREHEKIRQVQKVMGVPDDVDLPLNSLRVLEARYLQRDENRNLVESPKQLFSRVARTISLPERKWGAKKVAEKYEKEFFELMTNREFLPNSPTLMNAGAGSGQLSACFVIPVPDDMGGIFDAVKAAALIHQTGGGCISSSAKVFTTFCGLENIQILYEKLKGERKEIKGAENGWYVDVASENIYTISFNKEDGEFTKDKILAVWRYLLPQKTTVAVKAQGGLNLTVSRWHPFFVFENGQVLEKKADELKKGDWLVLPNTSIVKNWPFTSYQKIADLTVDEELSWLLGYLVGDGSFGRHLDKARLRFFDGRKDTLLRVAEILEKLTGRSYTIQKDSRGQTYCVTVCQQELIKKLQTILGFCGPKDQNLSLPHTIFKSPVAVAASFLSGLLDADGFVEKDKLRVSWSTSSPIVAEEIACLLALFGSRPATRARKPRKKNWAMMYEVSLEGRLEIKKISSFLLPYLQDSFKRQRFLNFLNSQSTHTARTSPLPFSLVAPYLSRAGVKINSTAIHRKSLDVFGQKFWLGRWKWGTGVCLDKVLALLEVLAKKLPHEKNLTLWQRVLPSLALVTKTQKDTAASEFYDLTVEKNNNYLAGNNGLAVVHNTGFSFSRLRPKGDVVNSTGGVASGPVSFMRVFNMATEVIKQGGKRRGANMGILRVDHPDILEFISCKDDMVSITNFNISVAVTEKFMKAVEENKDYDLLNPRDHKPTGKLNARRVFDSIVLNAWKNGDPGIIFIDRINKDNPTSHIAHIEATNPCGEQPLMPYDSCNLGSINLDQMLKQKTVNRKQTTENRQQVTEYEIDWEKLERVTRLTTRFLDNVIEANKFPLEQIDKTVRANRTIGLGVMGWADLLVDLKIAYNSDEAVKLAEKVMKFITVAGRDESVKLGKERGSFTTFAGSLWQKKGFKHMRNRTVTTIAPTGTIGLIADCSQGIEPIFALAHLRKSSLSAQENLGDEMVYTYEKFETELKKRGLYNEELLAEVARTGSIGHIANLPQDLKKIYVTAHEISPVWHLKMQAAFQKHTDNAVSKTVNFPKDAQPEDVEEVYMLAYKLNCKGVTIYRDTSRAVQVLNLDVSVKKKTVTDETTEINTNGNGNGNGNGHERSVDEPPAAKPAVDTMYMMAAQLKEKITSCPTCGNTLSYSEGCATCLSCGYSHCSV